MNALIMSDNRPQQIWDEIKTATSRPFREGDLFREAALGLPAAVISGKGVLKWEVGGVAGIKAGRTLPVCIVDCAGKVVPNITLEYLKHFPLPEHRITHREMRDALLEVGLPELRDYRLLRVQVLALKRYDVRDITHEEAVAEGFLGIGGFWKTWCELYDRNAIHLATWVIGGDVLRRVLKQRPAKLYDAWQIRFQRVLA